MLLRFSLIITSTSNYRLLTPLFPPGYTALSPVSVAAVCSNFPTISRMDMNRLSSSFSSCTISSPSGGRGRGQSGTRGKGQGSRGGGGRGTDAGGTSNRVDALGRILVRMLRHMAAELNLDMRSDGYVRVQDLLQLNLKSRANVPLKSHSIDEIREAVRIDNKQRLGLLEENGQLFIRANQGHSVQVVETESLLRPITSAEDIPVCVHGTYKKFLDSILQSGLKRMTRLHVHFSSGLPSDNEVISGMRRDINVVIFLDVNKALEDGMKLYMSENKVILTEGFDGVVPAKYFQKIQLWPSRKPVAFQI
ncbi:hypothetical protein KSS87_012641 [Heliosperma pusillum]|nr:hypothetical protein KSS87_012641 [Heliosperma pusillum]